jgi:GNAT superfamily N-acetyltransferase
MAVVFCCMHSLIYDILRRIANLRRNSRAKSLRTLKKKRRVARLIYHKGSYGRRYSATRRRACEGMGRSLFTVKNPPTIQTREWQWHEIFRTKDDSWFCCVAENKDGKIIGFAKGKTYQSRELPSYSGELNKIYLLFEYHRLGLRKKMMQWVAQRFTGMGIHNIVLFSEASNPTGWFYEAMGGKKLYDKDGKFHGGYGWDTFENLKMRQFEISPFRHPSSFSNSQIFKLISYNNTQDGSKRFPGSLLCTA